MLADDFKVNPQMLFTPQARNVRNEMTVDLGQSKWDGLKQFFFTPSVVSNQGWATTWKPADITGQETTCRSCRGNKLMYKKNLIGRITDLKRCIICNGTGKVFREKIERSNR